MRGTCSPGYVVRARVRRRAGPAAAVLDGRLPSRWCRSRTSSGRTCGSGSRPTRSTAPAPSSARRRSRSPGEPLPAADAPLAPDERAVAAARRGQLARCASSCERTRRRAASGSRRWPSALRFNNLKIAASEQAPRVCQGAMGVCGIVGLQERHAVQRRPPPARHDVGVPDGRQRAHPPDQRGAAADRQGRLSRVAELPRPARDRRAFLGGADRRRAAASRAASPGVYGRGGAFEERPDGARRR